MKRIAALLLLAIILLPLHSCDNKDEFSNNRKLSEQISKNFDIKILAIGNSYTDDATRYLPGIIHSMEENSVFVAKLVKGASSLEDHWENYSSASKAYQFYYNGSSKWNLTDITTINEAVGFCDWDIIVFQQLSYLAGDFSSYLPYLKNLTAAARKENPDAKIAWQMTWAYASNCTYSKFESYGYDRQRMYDCIVNATEQVSDFVDIIIPSGKLIEELRHSDLNTAGDLTRDGYHLDKGMPCEMLSHLWHECLVAPYTGKSSLLSDKEQIIWLRNWIEANQIDTAHHTSKN